MKLQPGSALAVAMLALAASALAADHDDDDAPAEGLAAAALPTLTLDQQRAAGVVVAHPTKADVAQRSDAIGVVLDPVALITDCGEADATGAAARASAAEVERVRGLYGAGAGASLKALQSAQAEQARTHAQADAAMAKFTSRWRPVAALPASGRQKLLDALGAGTTLLLRADVAGRHMLASVPESALIDVDGVGVPGKVLGAAAPSGEDAPSASVLIEVRNPPPGLGPGARVPVALLGAPATGVVVPRDAVMYDEGGALVYKQLAKKTVPSRPAVASDQATHYAPMRVKLIQAYGDGWLVHGIDDDDDIVVHGAGVLWSLQGIVGHAAGDNDDD